MTALPASAALRPRSARMRTAVSWLAGLAILAIVLARIDLRATGAALAGCDLARFVPASAAFLLVALGVDALVLTRLFGAALQRPLPWTSMLVWRAASYTWLAVSYHAANGALLAQLRSSTGASWPRLASAMLVHYAVDATALVTIALLGSLAAIGPIPGALRAALGMTWIAGVSALILACGAGRVLRGHALGTALAPFRAARLGELVLGRMLWYAALVLFVLATLPSFGLRIPASDVAARMPLVLALGALPLAPGGIGSVQAGMIALFADRAPAPALLAYSLGYSAVLLLARVPIGALAWLCTRAPERAEDTAS